MTDTDDDKPGRITPEAARACLKAMSEDSFAINLLPARDRALVRLARRQTRKHLRQIIKLAEAESRPNTPSEEHHMTTPTRTLEDVEVDLASITIDSAERRKTHEQAVRHLAEVQDSIAAGSTHYSPQDLAEAKAAEEHARLGLEANKAKAEALEEERRQLRAADFRDRALQAKADLEAEVSGAFEAFQSGLHDLVSAVERQRHTFASLDVEARELWRLGEDSFEPSGLGGPLRIDGVAFRRQRLEDRVQTAYQAAISQLTRIV